MATSSRGSTSAAATTRTMPSVAATTFRQYRGGTGARSQGRTQDAATNAYRISPIASTKPPAGRVT